MHALALHFAASLAHEAFQITHGPAEGVLRAARRTGPSIGPGAMTDFTIGGRRRIHLGHLKLPEWLKAVRDDRTQLQFLLEKTQSVTAKRDGKLAELKAFIEGKVRQPTVNRDGNPTSRPPTTTPFFKICSLARSTCRPSSAASARRRRPARYPEFSRSGSWPPFRACDCRESQFGNAADRLRLRV